jgi:hypothetical protein
MKQSSELPNKDYEATRAYYERALNTIPFYSQLGPFIPFPSTNAREIMVFVIILMSLVGSLYSALFITFPACLVIALLFEIKNDLREKVIEECIDEEWMLADDLAKHGGDPYFPNDADHIVDSDREFIFRTRSRSIKRRFKSIPKLIIVKKYKENLYKTVFLFVFLFVCQTLTHGEPVAWFYGPTILSEDDNA